MIGYDEYMEIPFVDHGRDRSGCDCYGLVRLIYRERYGVALPELLQYRDTRDREGIAAMVSASVPLLDFAQVANPREGDVALIRQQGQPCHLGLLISARHVLHTERASGPRVDEWSRPHIKPRIEGFYRYGT